jgi:hypothetical protein
MFLHLPWKYQKSRVYNCKLNNDYESYLLNNIRDWVINQEPSVNTSTHWWFKDLPHNIKDLFNDVANNRKITEMFKKSLGSNYAIDILHDMNEVYVSPPSNNNKNFEKNASDNIFYTRHIDGPFYYIPFASCYRVIIGLDDNRDIMTVFNIIPETYIIKTGDVVAFDFNRECHYITPIIRNNIYGNHSKYRVVLKIHYCVYHRWAIVFGFILSKLSIMYNKLFRDLFLFTIAPKNNYTKYLANTMILSTKVYHDIEYYIGNNNIQYLAYLYYMSLNTHYCVFLYGSSFVHYLKWVDTFCYNNGLTNNIFRRDYYFYKFLYMLQFTHMFLKYRTDNPVLYTYIIVPTIFLSYLCKYTVHIPKIIELYLTFNIFTNNIELEYYELYYIYINVFFNYIQMCFPIDM